MLQDIREHAKGRAAKIVIGVIAVALGGFGLESIFTHFTGNGGREGELVRVNGESIPRTMVDNALRNMMAQHQLIDGSEAKTREMLRAQLIDDTLVRQYLNKGQFSVSRGEVLQYLMPMLGADTPDKAASELMQRAAMNHIDGEAILAQQASQLQRQMLEQSIQATVWSTPSERQSLLDLQQEARTFRYHLLSAQDVTQAINVDETEMQQYYDAHRDEFIRPEQVRFDYILLDRDTLSASQSVTEQALRQAYVQRQAKANRRASDIVINITSSRDEAAARARMQEIEQQLHKGRSFATLAQQYSDDAGSAAKGGDLGSIEPGIYGEAFDKALQQLDVGAYSAPFMMDGALHLVKVTGIDLGSFEQLKPALTRDLQHQLAGNPYDDAVRQLTDLVDEVGEFSTIATTLGVPLQHADWRGKDDHSAPFENPRVMEEAFDPEVKDKGYNSQLIHLDDHRTLVLHVAASRAAQQLEFAEVKDQLRARVKQQKLTAALATEGQRRLQQLQQNHADTSQWISQADVTRASLALEKPLLKAVFSVPRPRDGKPQYAFRMLEDGKRGVLIQLQHAIAQPSDSQRDRLKAELEFSRGKNINAAMLEQLRRQAKIDG